MSRSEDHRLLCVSGTRGYTPCWYTMGRCAIRHRSPILRDPQEREECLSEVNAGLGEKIDPFQEERGSWNGRLTSHPSCGAESRPADLPARRGRGPCRRIPPPELTPEEVPLLQERQTALQAALEQLSAGERLLFYRKYYSIHRPDCLGVGAYGAGGGGTAIPAATAATEITGR